MRYLLISIFLCLSLQIKAQFNADSSFINDQYEYLSIVVRQALSTCSVFVSKGDSYEKKVYDDIEVFNLTIINKILEKYSNEGWIIQNCNMSVIGDDYPDSGCFYFLLSRKKT